jgi:RHS repeat-associated protein
MSWVQESNTNGRTNGPCPNWSFSASSNQLTTSGCTYDAAGDLTTDCSTGHTYQWDAEGRVSSEDSGSTATFTYDAVGDRVQWGSDGYFYDPAGNWLGTTGGIHLVPFGGHYLTVYFSGETYFQHVNHLNSVTMVGNHSGGVTEDIVFYPWGQNTWKLTGSGGYIYAGMPQYDPNVEVSYGKYRFYSPNLGRWHSPDPVGGDITNPQSLNRYAYVMNNPTTLTDPLGLGQCPPGTVWVSCNPEQAAQSNLGGLLGQLYNGLAMGDSCYIGGILANCAMVFSILGSEGGVQCPGNVCSGWNTNGQWSQYYAFAGAAGAVNGYYAVWGVGSLQYSLNQAGISASEWGTWYLGQTGSEVGGSLWCAYGVCSSTLQQPGPPTEMHFNLTTDFSDIPSSTQGQGWWRAQTGEFSPYSDYEWMLGTPYSIFTGTPSGRVLLVGPTTGGSECVLLGGALPADTIPGCGP